MVRRPLVALVPALWIVALASVPAAATTATTVTTEAGTEPGTTEATAPAVTLQPAVPVETTPAVETRPDWTYRFFIPTLLALAALVVIVTVIQYFTRVVRNRYRTVR